MREGKSNVWNAVIIVCYSPLRDFWEILNPGAFGSAQGGVEMTFCVQ